MNKVCAFPSCGRVVLARDLCSGHYQQRYRSKKELTPLLADRGTRLDRNLQHINLDGPDGCWLWTGSIIPTGYGHVWLAGRRRQMAHRWLYQLLVEEVPDALQMDHLCRVRSCVNPDHLQPVFPQENTLRGLTVAAANAAKTHCPRGHEYTEDNTYHSKSGRQCRTCRNNAKRAARAAKRVAAN